MEINLTQIENFKTEGFMIVPDFLSQEELNMIREICDRSVQNTEKEMKEKDIREDRINVLGKKYFIKDARKSYPQIKSVLFSKKTAQVCEATIGRTAYLHTEQFVVKMTDSNTNFAWHQDSGYSVYQGGAAIHKPYLTCWVALDDMSSENGTISILPFSRSPSRDIIEHYWSNEMNAMVGYNGIEEGDLVEVKAGTLVAFSSFLLHKSGANTTNKPRRSYFMAFTPELFTYNEYPDKIYSSGDPLIINGVLAG